MSGTSQFQSNPSKTEQVCFTIFFLHRPTNHQLLYNTFKLHLWCVDSLNQIPRHLSKMHSALILNTRNFHKATQTPARPTTKPPVWLLYAPIRQIIVRVHYPGPLNPASFQTHCSPNFTTPYTNGIHYFFPLPWHQMNCFGVWDLQLLPRLLLVWMGCSFSAKMPVHDHIYSGQKLSLIKYNL